MKIAEGQARRRGFAKDWVSAHMSKKSGAWKKWLVALMVLGVGGYFVQRQMGGETASLEPTTAPAIHDINETEKKLEDLKLLFDGGYTDKDGTKFAKEVLEIDASQIASRYTYCLESLRSLQ